MRVRIRYYAYLTVLSLRDGENLCSILVGTFLPTLHGAVIFKNFHFCGVCWGGCKRKCLHVPTPLEVTATVNELLKAA